MKDAYTKLMVQQHTSDDAAFYEKLENIGTGRKHKPAWKAAVATACILMLIPVTVWAAENIFGVSKATQCQRPVFNNKPGIGLDIVYENVEDYSLKDFPEYIQELDETCETLHDSWENAETYLGIDLVSNSILAAEDTGKVSSWKVPGKHCHSLYRVLDGQLYFSSIYASYMRGDTGIDVKASLSVAHPTVDKAFVQQYCHGTSITFQQFPGKPRTVNTEEYTNPAGIPMLIATVSKEKPRDVYDDGYIFCEAYFAVNNITYVVMIQNQSFDTFDLAFYDNPREKTMTALLEVLDGFTIE